jgi:tetratricopeptide (TPR) repeat protein
MGIKAIQGRALKYGVPVMVYAAALLVFPLCPLSAQTAEIKDAYYDVVSDGGSADASLLIRDLELRLEVFNRLFGFDLSSLASPLKVRSFKDKAAYDAYVQPKLGTTQNGAVYLHFPQRARRELVIHRGSPEAESALPYQAFVQYLRAFVANPPAWMREGFAIYFNTLRFNPDTLTLEFKENLSWLEPVKALGASSPSLESVLLADSRGAPDHFQALSWSLVSFFLNSGKEIYSRTVTELFMTLSATASAETNAEEVMRRITIRANMATFRRDYAAYLASRKTFNETLRDGQTAYTRQDRVTAELNFQEAKKQNPNHYAPYYYLGLLAYEEDKYALAEQYYLSALEHGADSALIRFAMGLNAAKAGRTDDAVNFLRQAAETSPLRYKARSDDLIRQLNSGS